MTGDSHFADEAYNCTLLDNAFRWAASPDAMAWAKKNPKRICKN